MTVARRPVLPVGEPVPSPPRQARSIERRRRLRRAAQAVFADRGFGGASVEEITSRAGVAVGAFYLYFASKRHLLIELMNELLQRIESLELVAPERRATRQWLRRFLMAALRTDRENRGTIRAWREAVAGDAALARMNRTVEKWTNGRVLAFLRGVRDRADGRSTAQLEHLARVVDAYLWMLLGRAGDTSTTDFEDEIRVVSDMIYHYLVPDRRGG